jgi:hypothetical protein
MKKNILLCVAILCGIVTYITPAHARQSEFSPALGDVVAESNGPERAIVSEEGTLQLWSYTGEMLAGFPILPENSTIITSPIFANITGTGHEEIVVVVKQNDGQYALVAFDGIGAEVAHAVLGNTDVYFDPIVVESAALGFEDIMVVDVLGHVVQAHYENTNFVLTNILDLGAPVALAYVPGGVEMFVSYPEILKIEKYTKNSGQNWILESTFDTPNAIIYPVVDNGQERIYGIDRNGHLTAMNNATGDMVPGFPVEITSMPRTSPVLVEVSDEHDGKEIIVQGQNRKEYIVNTSGVIINILEEKQSFLSSDVATADIYQKSIFKSISGFGVSVWNGVKHTVFSVFSSIKMVVTDLDPNITVSVGNTAVDHLDSIDIGEIALTQAGEYIVPVTMHNAGSMELVVDSGMCDTEINTTCLVDINSGNIAAGAEDTFSVVLTATNNESLAATVHIYTNDPDTQEYIFTVSADPYINLIEDGNMEDVAHEWRRWSRPNNVDYKFKTTAESYNTEYSFGEYSSYIDARANEAGDVHAGIQQLNIPVEAGKSYKFSFKYKLLSGEINSILGVRSSNADIGATVAPLTEVSQEWQSYERTFIVPSYYIDDFRVRISVYSGEAYIDEVIIKEISAISIIKDGDMESADVDSWRGWGRNTNWRKNKIEAHEGDQSMEIGSSEGTSGGLLQSHIPFDHDKKYEVSFWYKVESGSLYATIADSSTKYVVRGLKKRFGATAGEWKEHTFVVKGEWFTTNNPLFLLNVRSGQAFVDDISATEIADMLILEDGNMEETDLGQWQNYSNSIVLEKTKTEAHTDEQALYAQTTNAAEYNLGGAQYLDIPVEAGKTYDLSFWYKVNGSLIPRLGIQDSDNDFELTELDVPELSPAAAWAEYPARRFTVPNDFEGDFRLVFRLQSWYVDGVEEIEYEGVIYEAPHHVFVENGEMWIDDVLIEEVVE